MNSLETERRIPIESSIAQEIADHRTPLAELADAVTQVPLVDGTTAPFVNFDYAASAPPLARVHRTVTTTMSYYASIHRGQSYLSRASTAAYEQAREAVAEATHARSDDAVIFTRNTTDALILLARSVPGRVVHLDIEHHANLLPWRGGAWSAIRAQETFPATLIALEDELRRAPAALLAVTGASNVTGECPPLDQLAALAHRHGARLAVDGAQLVPHRPLDLKASGVDYVACSGHKLYAPYGAGALIGRRDWLDEAPPHQPGGGAVLDVSLDAVQWKLSPARHEGGTPNLAGAVSLGSAFKALSELGFEAIIEHEMALYQQLLAGLHRLEIQELRIWRDHPDVVGVVSFNVPGYRPDLVAAYLSAEHGIGVRGGRFCAHPLLARFDLGESGAVRASIGLGTGGDDVAAILRALEALIVDGPRWQYATIDGYVSPDPDPRPPVQDLFSAVTTSSR
jgi:selenocysteine lyase/cysteine desulfurase